MPLSGSPRHCATSSTVELPGIEPEPPPGEMLSELPFRSGAPGVVVSRSSVGVEEPQIQGIQQALECVILGTSSGARNIGTNAAIATGGYIGVAAVWGAPVTGASMNPIRSLAPDVFGGQLSTYWIYLVGPMIGATIAVGFEYILKCQATAAGARAAQGTLDADDKI